MKNILTLSLLSFMAVSINWQSYAEQIPRGLSLDRRVKIVNYNPDDVTVLKIHYGYATDIMLDSNEVVQNVSVGDPDAWQVNPVGHHLFIKPQAASNTNMTVLTNERNYNFQLTSANSQNPGDQIYELKFIYPDSSSSTSYSSNSSVSPNSCTPTQCNWQYSFTGDKAIAPVQAFDDSKFTYFKFKNDGSSITPAIYNVDKYRNESLINYHLQDGYIVVNNTGKQFTFRQGNLTACVYNDKAIGDWSSIK